MIMRLLIAFTRWSWGVRPIWPNIDITKEHWQVSMALGTLLDLLAICIVILNFATRADNSDDDSSDDEGEEE